MKKILLTIVLVLLLVTGGVTIGIIQSNKAKTPTSTVEMDLNPGASFVVNSNNVVLSVAFTNEDADLIYSDIKVVGRNIEEVARDFTQKAIEASSIAKEYIDLDVNASADADTNCITITVSGNAEQCEKLKNSLVKKINSVFDENGIFGRAVADIKAQTTNLAEKYADIAEDLKLDASEFVNKTEAEVLSIINEQSKKLEGLTSSAIDDVEEFINGAVITNMHNIVDGLEAQIQSAQSEIASLNQQIASKKAEISDWQIQLNQTPALKEMLQGYIDLANNAIDGFNQQIKTLNNNIAELQSQVKSKLAEIEQKITAKIAELRQTAKTQFETLKATLNERIQSHKAALEAHKAEFEANKTAVLESIKAWRDSFNTQA